MCSGRSPSALLVGLVTMYYVIFWTFVTLGPNSSAYVTRFVNLVHESSEIDFHRDDRSRDSGAGGWSGGWSELLQTKPIR